MAREDEIRLIAYKIWEAAGCAHGHDCEHWYRAETIWEQQQKKNKAAAGSIAEATQPARQTIKRSTAGKKSRKPQE